MTSAQFDIIPTQSVTVPEDRQRKTFNEARMNELIESIRARGLINPIVVTRDLRLVAGERRLRAFLALGFDSIPAHYTDTLSEEELQLIEFEENVRRDDLTWQERVSTVAKFHALKSTTESNWTQVKSAEALNISAKDLADFLLTNEALVEGVPEVVNSPKQSSAISFARRRLDRKKASESRKTSSTINSAIGEIFASPDDETPTQEIPADLPPEPDFPWSLANEGFGPNTVFPYHKLPNLLHCDFPYGVDATKIGQSSAKSIGGYSDNESDYWELLDSLESFCETSVAESAHMIFWFSMKYYEATRLRLEAMGWKVYPLPLIWGKSDNRGIIFDSENYPRNIYEVAFLCSRGGRQLVRARSNVHWSPTTKEYHMSEKPFAMLEYFLSMLVDEFTILYDPTCGSAMSVRVASSLGAEFAYGTELNPEYYEEALRNLESN